MVLSNITSTCSHRNHSLYFEFNRGNQYMKIQLENICYYSGSSPIISKFQMSCSDEGVYHFTGPNGSGKSTIFKALNGEIYTSKALVSINDKSINIYKTNQIAYVKDDFLGYAYLKSIEYLMYIKYLFRSNFSIEEIKNLSKKIEFSVYFNFLIKNLSQGNKQKLAFLSIVISNAKLIISDEGFENFDQKSLKEALTYLNTIANKRVIFLASHTDNLYNLRRKIVDVSTKEVFFEEK